MGGEGLYAPDVTALPTNDLCQSSIQGEVKSEAVRPDSAQTDFDLQAVIDAWSTLSASTKASIMGLVQGDVARVGDAP